MLELVLALLIVIALFRVGLWVAVVAFKLMLGLLGLVVGGGVALSAIGLVMLIGGALGLGLMLLVTLALAPLWLPLLLAGLVLWALMRPSRTAHAR